MNYTPNKILYVFPRRNPPTYDFQAASNLSTVPVPVPVPVPVIVPIPKKSNETNEAMSPLVVISLGAFFLLVTYKLIGAK